MSQYSREAPRWRWVFGAGGHPERGASLVCVSKGVPCVCFKYLKCILAGRGIRDFLSQISAPLIRCLPPLSDLELQLLSMRIPSPARLLAAIGGLLPLSPQPTVQIVGDVYLDVIAKVDELPSWDGDTTIQSPIQTVAAPQHAQTCGSARAPAAPAQDALGGSRERPGHGAPSHCLGRVSQLPPSSSQLPPSAAG